MRSSYLKALMAPVVSLAILTGCGADQPADNTATASGAAASRSSTDGGPTPNYAPHINSAQTTGVDHAGPAGPTEGLSREKGDLTYTHLGPGHFGAAISPPYPNGKRVIWSNGAERISKLDYDSLEVVSEYPLTNSPIYKNNEGLITEEQADKVFSRLD